MKAVRHPDVGGEHNSDNEQAASKPVETIGGTMELVERIQMPAVRLFVAADFFKIGDRHELVIQRMSEEFVRHMVPKIERDVPARVVGVCRLTGSSKDLDIIRAFGEDPTIALAHLETIMRLRNSGVIVHDKGSMASICYCKNAIGNIRVVTASRSGIAPPVRAARRNVPRETDSPTDRR